MGGFSVYVFLLVCMDLSVCLAGIRFGCPGQQDYVEQWDYLDQAGVGQSVLASKFRSAPV